MRIRLAALIAALVFVAGCTTSGSGLSPAGSAASPTVPPPPNVDADCNPIQPSHTTACDRIRAQATDLDDQIAALQRSLDGPPRPTGPERADIMRRITDLEHQRGGALGQQLAACDGRGRARRQPTADVSAYLIQTGGDAAATLTVSPVGPGLPSDGVLRQALSGQELVLLFTQSGCTVDIVSLPTGQFKITGVPRDFRLGSVLSGSHGSFHPVSGQLDLHLVTTLKADVSSADPITIDLTTQPPPTSPASGRNVDSNGNVRLVMTMPLSLDAGGTILPATGVQTATFTFDGRLSARPPR